ncbi:MULTISPECIES: type VI secretion system tube protein Hcp [Thermomonas]|jgi:type VI secretion system secreted protein Hcp|uniref:Type VI secretion system tube protein Hcp n=1 Tax=Thermomonas beijingensis TaxID=2872701 RepID=A0ABS7TDZ5_9GAMM|nr:MULTISPECIES: type VI secretion system tube protein Hcp [Thermomonas]MBS0460318.1 type VI secretion system tube protein Hcp [Pseudomonadota bacterium]MBZ4186089.1 type VI secretion system tube protein Hcp [Thermomonas beijingensis]HOC10137.1 type VI secretion system tube protein Hcp [Thermomonas sp.]HQA01251.1 type VI secretion system tube protein Hcp [Thermomonas sp.]HQE08735.1 type VI secretion system tube protein Hcp [Thermomonas sp.]
MASDIFMKIDGIDGESADAKHKGEIDVLAWSVGATNSGSMAYGGGGGTGKVAFQDLSITKRIDKSSPKMMEKCADGTHIKKAVLIARKQGGQQMDYVKITLSDLLVSSISMSGSGDDSETVSFNYGHIEYTYTAQKQDGSKEGDTGMKWNIKKNDKSGA